MAKAHPLVMDNHTHTAVPLQGADTRDLTRPYFQKYDFGHQPWVRPQTDSATGRSYFQKYDVTRQPWVRPQMGSATGRSYFQKYDVTRQPWVRPQTGSATGRSYFQKYDFGHQPWVRPQTGSATGRSYFQKYDVRLTTDQRGSLHSTIRLVSEVVISTCLHRGNDQPEEALRG